MTWLVVGAGFTGATVAERLASTGEEVLVVERRARVGGSAEDYRADDGLIIQKYGPHVFHTNSEKVWSYVQRFGKWRPIQYKVGARVGEHTFRLPLDFDMIRWAAPYHCLQEDLIRELTAEYGLGARVSILRLRERYPALADWAIQHVFRGYNEKHWGMPFEEVPASVLARLPFVVGEQESYFTDKYQAMPENGYTAVIERMLDHPNIELALGYDAAEIARASLQSTARTVIWTGSPDAFFGEAGALPYRSVFFMHGAPATADLLMQADGFATVTFPDPVTVATRVTSMLRLNDPARTGPDARHVCVCDIPEEYRPGKNDPFYPIPLETNIRKAQEYDRRRPKNVWFAGRLGSYTYLNMDQAIAQALALVERIRAS
jgi:UDP-galactopyranose mutase